MESKMGSKMGSKIGTKMESRCRRESNPRRRIPRWTTRQPGATRSASFGKRRTRSSATRGRIRGTTRRPLGTGSSLRTGLAPSRSPNGLAPPRRRRRVCRRTPRRTPRLCLARCGSFGRRVDGRIRGRCGTGPRTSGWGGGAAGGRGGELSMGVYHRLVG